MSSSISKNSRNLTCSTSPHSNSSSNKAQDITISSKFLKKKATELDFKAKFKTEMCKNFENGCCEFGDQCAFAHGEMELRSRSGAIKKYKTKKCKQFYEQGYCIYGGRCQFKHRDPSPETAENSPDPCKDSKKLCEPQKRRLPIFIDLETREI